jgi:hypothetical protein
MQPINFDLAPVSGCHRERPQSPCSGFLDEVGKRRFFQVDRSFGQRTTTDSYGSMAGLRELHLDAVDLPVELKCHTADCATSGYLQWLTKVGFRPQ